MAVTLVCETRSIAVDNETGIATGWLPGELSARYNGRPVGEVAALRSRHIDMPWPGGQSYRQVVGEMAGFCGT
ncbi:hypothetical protein ACWDRB_60405 [Nonomuraea sp. NPDC003707]